MDWDRLSLLITWGFCFREITCEAWELRLWENFLGRTNPSEGKKMYLPLFVLFLLDGAHLERVEGVFCWGRRNDKWCSFMWGVGQAKA